MPSHSSPEHGISEHSGASPRAARIDPAHPVRRATVGAPAAVAVGVRSPDEANRSPAPDSPPVERHAAELAERLQHRQEDIDRREAMLAAQEAEIENKLRSARMWFEERQRELDAREQALESPPQREQDSSPGRNVVVDAASLESRQRELDARQANLYRQIEELTAARSEIDTRTEQLARLEQTLKDQERSIEARREAVADERRQLVEQSGEFSQFRAELQQRAEDLADRDTELASREKQLGFRNQEIDTAIARFEKLGVTEERIQELDEEARQFAVRSRYLDKAEGLLNEETEALAGRRQQLEDQHRARQEQHSRDRRELASEREELRTASDRRTKTLDQRETQLDQREESLQNLRLELETTQREVLEMRLATEDTWAQLTGALAPAALTRSIAQTRSKLADLYESQIAELAERRQEFEIVRADLANEHTDLDHRRSQFQDWLRRREVEIEEQAGRLIAREQELDRQQLYYESLESRWRLERDDYRAEIRKLLSQLRTSILEAAA